jgi:uncharacterized protein involved in exopolysaccharide biosynthesis
METEIEILKSRVVYEDIVDSIGIQKLLNFVQSNSKDIIPSEIYTLNNKLKNLVGGTSEPAKSMAENTSEISKLRESFINYFINNIEVTVPRYSNVITITFTSRNPEFSFLVLSTLTEAFYKRHVELHFSNSATNFFEMQVKESAAQLNDKEQKIADLKNQLNISSLETSLGSYDNRIREIQSDIDRAQIEKASLQTKIEALKKTGTNIVADRSDQSTLSNTDKMAVLRELEVRERDLLTKYSEENNQVKEVRRQIESIKQELRQNDQGSVSISDSQNSRNDLLNAQMDLISVDVRIDELKKQLSRTSAEIKKLNEAQLELSILERDRDIHRSSYQKYAENLEEARIDGVVHQENMTNIEIIQKAIYPHNPIPSNRMKIMILAFIVGLGGSLAMAFFLNQMDHSIKTADDIEKKLKVHSLAVIPLLSTAALQKK